MPSIFNIPLVTLPVGTFEFGPTPVADSDTVVTLFVDRTVTNGFNSKTPSTTCEIAIFQSNDGGNNWDQMMGAGFSGGVFSNHAGQVNENDVGGFFQPGTGRLARAEVIIGGTSVAVQGSLVIN